MFSAGYLEMSDSEHKETVSATGWNVVSPEEARGSESESSCEFVNITDDCTASYSKEKPADGMNLAASRSITYRMKSNHSLGLL